VTPRQPVNPPTVGPGLLGAQASQSLGQASLKEWRCKTLTGSNEVAESKIEQGPSISSHDVTIIWNTAMPGNVVTCDTRDQVNVCPANNNLTISPDQKTWTIKADQIP